jgi:hypothetical protein
MAHPILIAIPLIPLVLRMLGRALWLLPDWCEKLLRLGYEIRRFRRSSQRARRGRAAATQAQSSSNARSTGRASTARSPRTTIGR